MKRKTRLEALKITAGSYHGGQWSALYQFASSGIYTIENHLRYLQEVESCMHPEYNLHPTELTQREELLLNRLKAYFIKAGEEVGIKTVFEKHNLYGYLIPYLDDDTPAELEAKVKVISYMK